MDRLVLEAKELLLLSSQIGASNFYGITDPFFGMTKDEVWGEIPQLQLQLEEKSLVSFGFDGSVEIRDDVFKAISTCALCERYITVDAILKGVVLPKRVLYEKGTHAIELTQESETITLVDMSAKSFIDGVMTTLFANCGDGDKLDGPVPIPQATLQNAQKDVTEAEHILRQGKCPEGMAAVIARGLNKTGGYCVITAFDLAKNSVSDFVCVIGDSGAVRLEIWPDEENTWKATWIRRPEIIGVLRAIVQLRMPLEGDADEAQ